ncbi:MAG: NAD-dependent isocitrate dehydrogenase [Nitriliruptorales bacterium]|nr:NAD-dependent isocitrate dehydrogenase [Nitriliruptorales bacterium]
MSPAPYSVCLIPGDGIGPEVVDCGRRVLAALADGRGGPSFTFTRQAAGFDAYRQGGDSLPAAMLRAAEAADAVLVGAMDVARLPVDATQPLRALRRHFKVHASVRPARTFPGVPAPFGQIDAVVVREVTEGMYSGIEYRAGDHAACGVRMITRQASTRAARITFQQAAVRRRKVTAVHKIGALKLTDSIFLEAVERVAEEFPEVQLETRNVDACALELVRSPADFDVILATNAFGDILSDVAAGLAGGLGLAPSGCVGERRAYFEPVHGTAPDIAGQGVANPLATVLSAALMLRHLGERTAAEAIDASVADVLAAGGPRTRDLGGSAGSAEITDAVINALSGAG